MHDQVVVGVLNGIADARKQIEAAVGIQTVIAAVGIDAKAGDVLHHKEGQP